MKTYIYLLVVTLFLASCENEIPFNIKENPPKLVINALFETGREKNEIVLALTGREKVAYIKEASINIYINGELKDRLPAPEAESTLYDGREGFFITRVSFTPDDVVRIEAKTNDGKYQAWSEVIVPHPIKIENTDATIVSKSTVWNTSAEYFRVKTTFTDNAKQTNYYRITMSFDLEYEIVNPNSLKDTTIYQTSTGRLMVNEDVVLTDGRPSTEDDDIEISNPVQNHYGVFDNSRINGTYTMITSMIKPYYYLVHYEPEWRENIKRIKVKAKVRLMSVSKMKYFYLKALNTYDSIDYDDYFNLPVRFPSNIEGGTGIFGISTSNEVVIPLDDYIPE